jgi:hypothetical protein
MVMISVLLCVHNTTSTSSQKWYKENMQAPKEGTGKAHKRINPCGVLQVITCGVNSQTSLTSSRTPTPRRRSTTLTYAIRSIFACVYII